MAFAFSLWIGLPKYSAARILIVATVVWLGVSTLLWTIHRNRLFHKRKVHADQVHIPGSNVVMHRHDELTCVIQRTCDGLFRNREQGILSHLRAYVH
jgi:hypothetical protein